MFLLVASLALLWAHGQAAAPKAHELDASYSFDEYLRDHGKSYTLRERKQREGIFAANLRRILAHNAVRPFSCCVALLNAALRRTPRRRGRPASTVSPTSATRSSRGSTA